MSEQNAVSPSILGDVKPSKAIIKLALPATLALLAKAVYNIVDTAYIGMLNSDIALTAVGVTVPLLLIMVSIENIFAAGASVLAGRQLGAKDEQGASRTVTTIIVLSMIIGAVLCVGGIIFIELLMRAFGASDASLPLAKDYAFWMFIAALADMDKRRSSYIKTYTDQTVGIAANYHMCLDSGKLGIESTIRMIRSAYMSM
ncbi:MAG: MATE family efflux transporter [Candidatus Fimadaptatus sp.]|jgi:Na+-driven multidrug efflux pump